MADSLSYLEAVAEEFAKIETTVAACRTKYVPSAGIQPLARSAARQYFEFVRPDLEIVKNRAGLVDELDFDVQAVLALSSEPQTKGRYRRPLKELRLFLSEAQLDLMKARGDRRLIISATERALLETLAKTLPPAAASYEQALRDIQQGERVSWRGPANELREVLREVIDHLAPDDAVRDAPGYQADGERTAPTQKQKVRYILRRRSSGSGAVTVAESSLDAVEEAVAVVARSTYTRSNVSTHTASTGAEIRNLKRYVDALLAELLAIS